MRGRDNGASLDGLMSGLVLMGTTLPNIACEAWEAGLSATRAGKRERPFDTARAHMCWACARSVWTRNPLRNPQVGFEYFYS